jgi:hypothetical protein
MAPDLRLSFIISYSDAVGLLRHALAFFLLLTFGNWTPERAQAHPSRVGADAPSASLDTCSDPIAESGLKEGT